MEKETDKKYYYKKIGELYEKAYIINPAYKYTDIKKLIENQLKTKSSKEIFEAIKTKLNEMENEEIPKSLLNLYEEFSDLIKK